MGLKNLILRVRAAAICLAGRFPVALDDYTAELESEIHEANKPCAIE